MDEFVNTMFDALLIAVGSPELVVILVALTPASEARLALPLGIKYGLSPLMSFFLSFVGSCLVIPALLLLYKPIVKFIFKLKFMRRAAIYLDGKIRESANKISAKEKDKKSNVHNKQSIKTMMGVASFVALPLPLTGVWTGSAVAAILDLGIWQGCISVIVGNLFATMLVLLVSTVFAKYVNIILGVLVISAFLGTIAGLIRALLKR